MRSTIILRTAKKTASGVTFNRGKNGTEPRVLLGFVRSEPVEPNRAYSWDSFVVSLSNRERVG